MSSVNCRSRESGQAAVEASLGITFLIIILMGVAQVGSFILTEQSVASAAEAGVQVAVSHPYEGMDYMNYSSDQYIRPGDPSSWKSYDCELDASHGQGANYDTATESWICSSVQASLGTLAATNLKVTVTSIPADSTGNGISMATGGFRLVASGSCLGTAATVSGVISNISSGTASVSANSSDGSSVSTNSDSQGNYALCISLGNQNSLTTSIIATAGSGCSQQSVVGPTISVSKKGNYTVNLTLPTVSCSTPTPAPSSSPTASATPAPSPSFGTPQPVPTAASTPVANCTGQAVSSSSYVEVTVSYTVPIYVPFIGQIIGQGSKLTNVSSNSILEVLPCNETLGK